MSRGKNPFPLSAQHLGTLLLNILACIEAEISWATNCPHCISMEVTEDSSLSTSLWILTLISLADGSLGPKTDLLTLWIPERCSWLQLNSAKTWRSYRRCSWAAETSAWGAKRLLARGAWGCCRFHRRFCTFGMPGGIGGAPEGGTRPIGGRIWARRSRIRSGCDCFCSGIWKWFYMIWFGRNWAQNWVLY